jgi:ABC-type branched-subunit amino acid transport system ATPase component
MTALLKVQDLHVAYGEIEAVKGISLEVEHGQTVALLGTNGAGKTTLLRAIAGLTPVKRGTICYGGHPFGNEGAPTRVERGVVMVPGGAATFPHMTVMDNLLVGCHRFAWDRLRVRARVTASLELFPRLGERLDQTAGSLSGGEQQMLALAKALLPEPSLLLVDELSLGLAPVVIGELVAALGRLRDAGTTMVVVEQSVRLAAALADRVVWLEKGRVRFVGPPGELPERLVLGGA